MTKKFFDVKYERCEVILSTGTKIRIQFLLDIDFVNSRKQKGDDWN